MAEHPDDILRALADPERLEIAGALARGESSARGLAEALGIRLERVRKHLNRLAAAGVVRLRDDRATYRLDPETPRWAAEQVGSPRHAGLALGAANEDEEAVLRAFFRDGRLREVPAKESKRRIVLERIALEFDPVSVTTRTRSTRCSAGISTTMRRSADTWSTEDSSSAITASTGGPAVGSTWTESWRHC
jgi:DNA-binding transcriptional ArsR family regulator